MATGTAAVRPGLGSIANPANTRYSWFCFGCLACCNCLVVKRILARLTGVWVSRWEWIFYVFESGLWSQMVVTRVDLIWFMVVLRFSTLMIHDDSVQAMQLFLISAQQSWFIGFIVPLGEHNQTLHCTRRIRKRYLGFHKILKPVICHAWKHKNPSVKRTILCEPTFWLLLRRWKMPMHTLRTGLYALVHSGFCRVFFLNLFDRRTWNRLWKSKASGLWFDLLFNSDSLVHLRVSKRYHTSTGKPKIRPIGVGSLKLGDGIGMIP